MHTPTRCSNAALSQLKQERDALREALVNLRDAGDLVGGYDVENGGHNSAEADFLRKLNAATALLSTIKT